MSLLAGKKVLIFGIANKDSIAWGIAQAMHEQGAEIGISYSMQKLERRVRPLAEEIGATLVEEANILDDDAIDRVFAKAKEQYGTIDVLVHSIAYAEREDLQGRFVDTSRSGFKTALEVSAYSMVALAQRAEKLMPNGGSMLTLTYYGGVAVMPHYNVMGVAKAALDSCVRYLAYDLGPQGIRVNAISAGPIKTLAASGVGRFRKLLSYHEEASPLRKAVTQDDVGRAAVWLSSDWARSVTGEVLYVDSGWNILGLTVPVEEIGALE